MRQGGLRDAILHSAGANAAHGLRRTNADKRRAVLMLLEDEEWATWADREIARRCAVDHTFVGRMRGSLVPNTSEPAPRTYQDRHGNVSQMDTARIGRRTADHVLVDWPIGQLRRIRWAFAPLNRRLIAYERSYGAGLILLTDEDLRVID